MTWRLWLTWVIGLTVSGVPAAWAANPVLDGLAASQKVRILYEYSYDAYFADTLLERGCGTHLVARDPNLSNIGVVSGALASFLVRYPQPLLAKSLGAIHLLSDLQCDHVPYGGTVSEKGLYVEVYGYTSRDWLLDALHHEFSSLLWRNRELGFDKEAFERISGSEAYNTSIERECLKKSNCRGATGEDMYRKGFLAKYATTTLENDFNVYAEYLFAHADELAKLAAQYPLIQQKAAMMKAFYGKLGVTF